jgi:hypothetical protein
MNWERFGRKLSKPDQVNIPTFSGGTDENHDEPQSILCPSSESNLSHPLIRAWNVKDDPVLTVYLLLPLPLLYYISFLLSFHVHCSVRYITFKYIVAICLSPFISTCYGTENNDKVYETCTCVVEYRRQKQRKLLFPPIHVKCNCFLPVYSLLRPEELDVFITFINSGISRQKTFGDLNPGFSNSQ